VSSFSFQNPVNAGGGDLIYVTAATLSEISDRLSDFDVLVVPGSMPYISDELVATPGGARIAQLIKRFPELPPRKEVGRGILQSVCTGSLLLTTSDVLRKRTATTHHIFYDALPTYADKAAGGNSEAKAVKKRWVHAGKTEGNVEIVTAGGVSSGIDASLFIVELLSGKEAADWSSEIAEFDRRGQDDAWGVGK
jgi:putative intracellular protease/amidase